LIAQYPEADLGNRDQWLVALWPSENPQVAEPLKLDTEIYPSLYWFRGYMWDFTDDEPALPRTVVNFLRDFFAERYACGVRLEDDEVMRGGPVDTSYKGDDAWWNDPEVVIRSWGGTFDRG
jgi:hypothetical protein